MADYTIATHSMIQQHSKHFLYVSYTPCFIHGSLCKSLPSHPLHPSIYHLKQYPSFYATAHVLLIIATLLYRFCFSVTATLCKSNGDCKCISVCGRHCTLSDAQIKPVTILSISAQVETSELPSVSWEVKGQEGARMVFFLHIGEQSTLPKKRAVSCVFLWLALSASEYQPCFVTNVDVWMQEDRLIGRLGNGEFADIWMRYTVI